MQDAASKISPSFCILPWIHLNVIPDGRVLPCCMISHTEDVGHVEKNTLEQIANSPEMNLIRKQMLSGERPHRCRLCFNAEDRGGKSHRQYVNTIFESHMTKVNPEKTDGTIERFEMVYWDVRFSNICNFRCRTCTPNLSSSWHAEAVKIFGHDPDTKAVIKIEDSAGMWEQLREQLPYVEEIYLIGGEPLIEEQQWRILELLKENKLQDKVRLRYNTNLSSLSTIGNDVLKKWREFKNIEVIVSLDGAGSRGEYIRKGLNWNSMSQNLRALREISHVRIWINFLVSVFNAHHFADFAYESIKSGLIQPGELVFSPLYDPDIYSVNILTPALKAEVAARYRDLIIRLRAENFEVDFLELQTKAVVNFMNLHDHSERITEFLNVTKRLDNLRNESFESTFPEYAGLFKELT